MGWDWKVDVFGLVEEGDADYELDVDGVEL